MRKGFTLIELLVVIAIIAILAAILFPVFIRARVTAITTKCGSHGRELGIAMQMYMDDNSGRFPSNATSDMLAQFSHVTWRYNWPLAYPGFSGVWGVGGMNQYCYIHLARYVKNAKIWVCPNPESWYAMKYAYGYRNSWFFIAGKGAGGRYPPYPDTAFVDPLTGVGRTVAEVLSNDLGQWHRSLSPSQKIYACCYATGDLIPVEGYTGGPVANPNGSYPHDEGTIYVYVDGHARYRETGRAFFPVRYTTHILDTPHVHRK